MAAGGPRRTGAGRPATTAQSSGDAQGRGAASATHHAETGGDRSSATRAASAGASAPRKRGRGELTVNKARHHTGEAYRGGSAEVKEKDRHRAFTVNMRGGQQRLFDSGGERDERDGAQTQSAPMDK